MSENPTIKLNPTGQLMPLIGVGMWQVPRDKATNLVIESLKIGYRLVDAASDYGNEKEIGLGLKKAFDTGIVKREDIFVTSKLWNTNHARKHVREACERSLRDLQLDHLDLYLIHFPISLKYVDPDVRQPAEWFDDVEKKETIPENITIQETWQAMEELVDAGLVKNIGVSNFCGALILELLKFARIKPSVLQIEHSPYLTQERLINYVKSQGIAVTGYSNFGNLSYKGVFPHADSAPILFDQPVIKELANKYGKSPAQIVLKWSIQRQIAIIPKSLKPERLAQNRDLSGFELTQEELHKISSLNTNLRFNDPGLYSIFPIFD
ncbi:xylose reductase 2 [Glomus cerebriforme]|uniref:Xylose reductase 2 n=1 Tax=Glomus cerebriforme TaxID=658196 RepID=A0A397T5A4_9GLOM|nr:xylose reductase 2 [Glomus cerebriforme]